MNNADVLQSITRFLPLLRMEEQEIKDYAATIVEACGWMQPIHFEETCKEMLREIAPGRKPVPKQYIAVYNRLANQNGWNKPVSTKPDVIHHTHMWEQLKDLKPKGARWILSMVEAGKVKYPDDIYTKIVEIAGQDEPAVAEQPSPFAKAIENLKVDNSDEWELAS